MSETKVNGGRRAVTSGQHAGGVDLLYSLTGGANWNIGRGKCYQVGDDAGARQDGHLEPPESLNIL